MAINWIRLSRFSEMLPHLDYLNMKKGSPLYSFPKEVHTTCNSGKSYHFWYSAYLTRSLIRDHAFDPESAARATFITHKGYQLIKEKNYTTSPYTSSKLENILNQKPFEPGQQIVRMDIAYAAAGSQFGAAVGSYKKQISFDIDKTFIQLIKNGSATKVDSGKNILSHYLKFDQVFAPDSAFKFLEN